LKSLSGKASIDASVSTIRSKKADRAGGLAGVAAEDIQQGEEEEVFVGIDRGVE
jgi:hypothetical protein